MAVILIVLLTNFRAVRQHCVQRFSAIRRQGFLPLNFLRRTELQI